jgi:two-component system NtrC family response regulator
MTGQQPPIIAGTSPAIRRAVELVDQFARSQLPFLVVGATGTGKELIARRIHDQSGRSGELVDVNCGALPSEMIESLLFGHRRGSFTGAVADMSGLIELADRGTLFLDELASLPVAGQAKLLRVLETREVRRIGGGAKVAVDFRLIAAVQEDPADLVEQGLLRLDLAQRLAGVVVELPPLARRREDIVALAHHFAAMHGCTLAPNALKLLAGSEWPGNARELKVRIERAAIGSGVHQLTAEIMAEFQPTGVHRTEASLASAELVRACAAVNWDANQAAELLGISRATLYRRLKEYGLALGLTSRAHGRLHRDPSEPNLTPA